MQENGDRSLSEPRMKVTAQKNTVDGGITERKMLEERLSALNSYGGKLNTATSFEQVYELTLDAMEKTLGFEHAAFMTVEKGKLKIARFRGYPEPLSLRLPLDGAKKGITVRAANTRKTVLVDDVTKDEDYVEGAPNIRSELAVPIEIENRVIGVLDVESKKVGAFNEKDAMLLQILASHAATAVSDIEKRQEIEKRSSQLSSLMKSSAEMIRSSDLRQRLQKIAEAIRELGWRRVVISVRDENMEIKSPDDLVTVGLTEEEKEFLWKNRPPGHVWRERFGPEFERFKIGEFFYLKWSDPWVREKFSKGTVESKLKQEDMVDWDPQDLLYAPLCLAEGRIVGVLSIDDPLDGKRPTQESLAPLELFIHQAVVAIENAKLIQQLKQSEDKLKRYSEHLEELVEERTVDLRKSEEKLKSIFAASPDPITVTDLNGNIIECNAQSLKMKGYSSKEELIGKNVFEFIAEKDRQKVTEYMKKTLEQGLVRNIEYTSLTKDGRESPAEVSASIVKDASGNPISFVAILKDITERKQMEQQLLKSERLVAIGEVAAMVGHDLRNPLTGIAGAAYYLKLKLGSEIDDKVREMLELIEKDIEHSNKIIDDLLEYSKEMRLEITETTPKAIIKEALSLIRVPENIQVVDSTQNEPKIRVDVEKLKRVFVNLIKNAIDAMNEGGKLAIENRETNGNLEFVIADTGIGMSKDIMENIWTPLYTTKAKGMGLGLPICKRIVEAHGGDIAVESTVGRGTKFTVTISIKPKDGGEKTWVDTPESLLLTTTKA